MNSEWSNPNTATPTHDTIGSIREIQRMADKARKREREHARHLKAFLDTLDRPVVEDWLAKLRATPEQTIQTFLGIETMTQYLADGTVPNL